MNAYELADLMFDVTDCETSEYYQAGMMLRQQADRIAELEDRLSMYEIKDLDRPQIKDLSDEENNLKWWISSFEHLKALGGGINDEMEAKLKEMKEKLKKANEK
jgi:hypothetical protein